MENYKAVIRPAALAVALSCVGNASAIGNGSIVSGSGAITKNGNTVNVNQNSSKMIVKWDNMNVGKSEQLNFNQPGSNSAVLNRVNSIDPTVIAGVLNANGNVFVVNPNGVLINNGAAVNVGSLVASSLDISNENFNNGNYRFSGTGKGRVINEGKINAKNSVAMLGAGEVTNNGTIISKTGNINLAAGSDITLYFPAMGKMAVSVNKGSLNALVKNGGIIVSDNGAIALSAWATDTLTRGVINNTGTLEAKGFTIDESGGISLTSQGNGDINLGGTLSTSLAETINVTGKNITVADDTKLSTGLVQLASTARDGYVKTGRLGVKIGHTLITADNVITSKNGGKATFAGEVSINTTTAQHSLDIADTTVTSEDKIHTAKGVVSADFIDAVRQSRKQLKISNNDGDINVSNAQQNYGWLTLGSGRNVNINRQMKGEDLSVSGETVNQATGADITMANSTSLMSNKGLVQNAAITTRDLSLLSPETINQQAGVQNTADYALYNAESIVLDGNTQANYLDLYAQKNLVQGADSTITAKTARLTHGDFDLASGTNHIEELIANASSLDLTNLSGLKISPQSHFSGDLKIAGSKNLDIDSLNVEGRTNIAVNGDVRLNEDLSSLGGVTVSADNILSANGFSSNGYYWATSLINSNASALNLQAKGEIDIHTLSGDDVVINAKKVNINDVFTQKNAHITATDNVLIHNLYSDDAIITTDSSADVNSAHVYNDLTIRAGKSITFDNVNTGSDIQLTAANVHGNQINVDPDTFNAMKQMNTDNVRIQFSDPQTSRKPELKVNAGDINIGDINTSGNITLVANNSNSGAAGNISLNHVNAEGESRLTASNDVALGGASLSDALAVSAGGDVTLENTLYASDSVAINARNITGKLTNGYWWASFEKAGIFAKEIILKAADAIDLGNTITNHSQGGNVVMHASNVAAGDVRADNTILVETKNDASFNQLEGKSATITSHGAVTLTSAHTYGDLAIKSDGDLIFNTLEGDGNIALTADNIRMNNGVYDNFVHTNGTLTLNAKNTVKLDQVRTGQDNYSQFWQDQYQDNDYQSWQQGYSDSGYAHPVNNDLTINAGDIDIQWLSSAGNVQLNAVKNTNGARGDINVSSLTASGNAALTAQNNIESGKSNVKGDLSIRAEGDYIISGQQNINKNISVRAQNIKSTADYNTPWWAAVSNLFAISADHIDLQAKDKIDLGQIESHTDAQLKANNITAREMTTAGNLNVIAENNVDIDSMMTGSIYAASQRADADIRGNSVRVNKGMVNGDTRITARNDINYGANSDEKGNTTLSSSQGNIYLGAGNSYGGQYIRNLIVNAAGQVKMNGPTIVGNDLSVSAGDAGIALPGSLSVRGNAVLTTTGNIIQQATYGGSQFMVGKDLTYKLSSKSMLLNTWGGPLSPYVNGSINKIIK